MRNDVLSHHATVEAVNAAAGELLESSPGDEAGHLREQLDQLNHSWQNLLLKTQERQKLLEAALHQVEFDLISCIRHTPLWGAGTQKQLDLCSYFDPFSMFAL